MYVIYRKYGAATAIDGVMLPLSTGEFKSNPPLAAGDAKIEKNGAAAANLTTLPSVAPAGGYSVRVSLSSAEMTAARIVVRLVDQTTPKDWLDRAFVLETYGDAAAMHPALPADLLSLLGYSGYADNLAAILESPGVLTANVSGRVLGQGSTAFAGTAARVEVGVYGTGLDPATQVLAQPANRLGVDSSGRVALSPSGLDAISTAAPTGPATNFREMLVQLWRRFFRKTTLGAASLRTYADDGTTVVTTQSVADDGTTQTQGNAS